VFELKDKINTDLKRRVLLHEPCLIPYIMTRARLARQS
jgi:hypothetical protein